MLREVRCRILALILIFIMGQSYAGWRDEHERGWHWYETKESEREEEKDEKINLQESISYTKKLNIYRKKGEELRAKAILERTPQSVAALMEWEKKMWENSEHFGAVWQNVLRNRPDLDYSVTHPTAQYARHVYLDEQKQKIQLSLKKLKENYGLVFFFKGNCPYCHAAGPVISSIATRYGFSLHAISLDGGNLSGLKEIYPDNGISQRFNVTMVPAIFATNPITGDFFPIAYGAISEQEMEERILQIAEYQAYQELNHAVP